MKLWQKGYNINKEIEKFTVGNDHILDQRLVKYDCIASIAHAKMLCKIGVLDNKELNALIKSLNNIMQLDSNGQFKIAQEDEDCHTAIENFLTTKHGDVGKKIHTLRSRNDQVLTAIRLYEKEELVKVKSLILELKKTLLCVVAKNGDVKIPGYTHMQKAMPTDIKTWLGCYVDSTYDNLRLLDSTLTLIDQSPLGSAAGFGVPVFEIDKKFSAKQMGFSKVLENSIYCQISRGKFECTILHFLTQVMLDLNRLACDLILFSMKEFSYLTLPKEFCTGSSIMPQKKNPDVLELIRAKYHIVVAEEIKVKGIIGNLMSGYNRDLQLTKEPLFNSINVTQDCLKMMCLVLAGISVNKEACAKAMTPELYATEEVYKLVKKGASFRDAYKKVGKKYCK